VCLRGPQGKGRAEMAISRVKGSGPETPGQTPSTENFPVEDFEQVCGLLFLLFVIVWVCCRLQTLCKVIAVKGIPVLRLLSVVRFLATQFSPFQYLLCHVLILLCFLPTTVNEMRVNCQFSIFPCGAFNPGR
jgi:hypothetical protein